MIYCVYKDGYLIDILDTIRQIAKKYQGNEHNISAKLMGKDCCFYKGYEIAKIDDLTIRDDVFKEEDELYLKQIDLNDLSPKFICETFNINPRRFFRYKAKNQLYKLVEQL